MLNFALKTSYKIHIEDKVHVTMKSLMVFYKLSCEKRINMGICFNSSGDSFRKDKDSKIYIDKTRLLEHLNGCISTNSNYISISDARKFGKFHATGMIDALNWRIYYLYADKIGKKVKILSIKVAT